MGALILRNLENRVEIESERGKFPQGLQPARGIFKITFQTKYEPGQYMHLVPSNPRER